MRVFPKRARVFTHGSEGLLRIELTNSSRARTDLAACARKNELKKHSRDRAEVSPAGREHVTADKNSKPQNPDKCAQLSADRYYLYPLPIPSVSPNGPRRQRRARPFPGKYARRYGRNNAAWGAHRKPKRPNHPSDLLAPPSASARPAHRTPPRSGSSLRL